MDFRLKDGLVVANLCKKGVLSTSNIRQFMTNVTDSRVTHSNWRHKL